MRTIIISDYTFREGTCGLYEINGPYPGVETLTRNTAFCTVDSPLPHNGDPCVVPASGTHYSYAKSLFFKVNDWGDFSDRIGCDSVLCVGCGIDGIVDVDGSGIGLATLSRPVLRSFYHQADGIRGQTGYPLSRLYDVDMGEIRNLGDFTDDQPYIMSGHLAGEPFQTLILVVQAEIHATTRQGVLTLPHFHLVGVVE